MRTICYLAVTACLFVTAGCSEYGMSDWEGLGPQTDDGNNDDGTERDPTGNWDTANPDEPFDEPFDEPGDDTGWGEESYINGPRGNQPPEFIGDCLGGEVAGFSPSSELVVMSWNNNSASGTLTASTSGWYHVYNTFLAESGDSQWNESSFYKVTNSTNPGGKPHYGNCSNNWVVADADNYGPPSGSRIYIGTFWLDPGGNHLEMKHYCPKYRNGGCATHHNDSPGDSTCNSGNVNSVHFSGYGLCLMPAE